jgi:hypothetical protein
MIKLKGSGKCERWKSFFENFDKSYTRHNSRAYSKRLKISRPKEAETPRRHVVVPSLRISPAPLHLS